VMAAAMDEQVEVQLAFGLARHCALPRSKKTH